MGLGTHKLLKGEFLVYSNTVKRLSESSKNGLKLMGMPRYTHLRMSTKCMTHILVDMYYTCGIRMNIGHINLEYTSNLSILGQFFIYIRCIEPRYMH